MQSSYITIAFDVTAQPKNWLPQIAFEFLNDIGLDQITLNSVVIVQREPSKMLFIKLHSASSTQVNVGLINTDYCTNEQNTDKEKV